MSELLYVNLGDLITTVADMDLPDSEECKKIKEVRVPKFGSGITLSIDPITGTWIVTVFNREDLTKKISLEINSNGDLSVTRWSIQHGVQETRRVSF